MFLLAGSLLVVVPARADTNVVYVGLGEDGVGGSCESPDYGVASYDNSSDAIQTALNDANEDPVIDTVHICDSHALDEPLDMTNHESVTIEGDGYDESVISGDPDGAGPEVGVRLFSACGVDNTYTFRNLTLTQGYGNDWGGAIQFDGTLILDGVTVSENFAVNGGGAIDNCGNDNDSIEIYDSTFAVNDSAGEGNLGGGAILNWGGSVTVENSAFVDNSIDTVDAFNNIGGAIFANLIIVRGSTFEGNEAGDDGGAIYATTDPGDETLDAGSVEVSSSRFISNVSHDDGGAISAEGPINIRGSRFEENAAHEDGGAIDANGGLQVVGSSFTANTIDADGEGDGGAIWVAGALSVVSSSFEDNVAENGEFGEGGAINMDEDCDGFSVQSSTFTGNYAGRSGGAINFNYCLVSDTLRIATSRFTQNHSGFSTGGAVDVDVDGANQGGMLVVTGSRFTDNRAAVYAEGVDVDELRVGGAIWTGRGRLVRNTFIGNIASTCGGAVNIRDSRVDVRLAERSNEFRRNRSAGRRSTWNVCFGL